MLSSSGIHNVALGLTKSCGMNLASFGGRQRRRKRSCVCACLCDIYIYEYIAQVYKKTTARVLWAPRF